MRLVADRLTIDRGPRRLTVGLSFDVAEGGALVLTGPNGAGKSTLLRVVAGFSRPTEGRVGWEPARAEGAAVAEQAHYVGHADALKGALTAGENLAFWRAMLGGPGDGLSPADALAGLDVARLRDLPVRDLSAGQRRRVALARLLVAHRPLWLLDEPTAALDAAAQRLFGEVMRAHLRAGGLILAATHAPLGLDGAPELRLGAAA